MKYMFRVSKTLNNVFIYFYFLKKLILLFKKVMKGQ